MLWAKHDRKLASHIVKEEVTGSLTFPDSAETVELDFSINHQFEMVSVSDQDRIPASGTITSLASCTSVASVLVNHVDISEGHVL